jgi:hypothetical protein
MGNGASPHGPSYRAHSRLYLKRHAAAGLGWSPLTGALRRWRAGVGYARLKSSLRHLDDFVGALQVIIHTYLNDRMAFFDCQSGRLGGF